ncbi:MAG: serine/threonine-protein phosphatase [Propionibacteriales bacterium]|nr:serine/threonine-protein phosphatase [Propionibacteriales bacterium]
MVLSLRVSAASDIGRRRKNDDSGYAGTHFVMVADGMGGAPHGDLASSVAVQTMQRLDVPAPDDMLEALAGAVHRANDRLAEVIEEDSTTDGMGTTVTAVLFAGARIGVVHLGDSRGYLWRAGELLRITNDHSWVQSLIDEGRISPDEAAVHSHRSLLLKVLDGRHDNDPDLTVYDVEGGDRILLCSDGLSGFVSHERIERAMSIGTADAVTAELIALALDSPSNDNITVVVADVVEEPALDVEPLIVGAAAHPRVPMSRLRSWAHRDEVTPGEALVDPDADPEELRYAPRAPRRFQLLRRLVAVAVVLAVAIALSVVTYNWTQKQYYVAARDGAVAIYQGVQADLPGVDLHHVYEGVDLSLDELPSYRRGSVIEGLPADSLDDARQIVAALETMARTCANQANASSASTTTTQSATDKPTGTKKSPTEKPTGTKAGTSKTTDATKTAATTAATTGSTGAGSSAQECSGATPAGGTSQ